MWTWSVINPQLCARGRSPEQPRVGVLWVLEPSFPVLPGRSRASSISPSAEQALTTPASGGRGIWTRSCCSDRTARLWRSFPGKSWSLSLEQIFRGHPCGSASDSPELLFICRGNHGNEIEFGGGRHGPSRGGAHAERVHTQAWCLLRRHEEPSGMTAHQSPSPSAGLQGRGGAGGEAQPRPCLPLAAYTVFIGSGQRRCLGNCYPWSPPLRGPLAAVSL